MIGDSRLARQRPVPCEHTFVSNFDPLQIKLLAGALEGLTCKLCEPRYDLVDIRDRFLYESDYTEVGDACGEVGIVHRGHQKCGQACDLVAQATYGLETVDSR